MSIEQQISLLAVAIAANTAAVEALAAKIEGATVGTTAKAATTTTTTKSKPEVNKPKHTRDEMQAALNEVKEAKGAPAAKALITNAGFEKMKDITDDKIDALYDAAKAALAPVEDEEM